MPDPITITIPHKLSRDEAKTRLQQSTERLKQQLGSVGLGQVTHHWSNDHLHLQARALGQVVTGRIQVNPQSLKIEVELPGLLGAFAEKIAGRLRREGERLLEKNDQQRTVWSRRRRY